MRQSLGRSRLRRKASAGPTRDDRPGLPSSWDFMCLVRSVKVLTTTTWDDMHPLKSLTNPLPKSPARRPAPLRVVEWHAKAVAFSSTSTHGRHQQPHLSCIWCSPHWTGPNDTDGVFPGLRREGRCRVVQEISQSNKGLARGSCISATTVWAVFLLQIPSPPDCPNGTNSHWAGLKLVELL